MLDPISSFQRVIVVGAGFGGLFCAKGLADKNVQVTLIDSQNHHLFQPLLYQVATGFLGINDVAIPIRSLFRNKSNIEVIMAEVTGVNTSSNLVITNGKNYHYDYLVLATGSRYHFFGHDEWKKHVFVLKTLEDAVLLRQRILSAFESAELEADIDKRKELLTFIVIGGGPTGVETAGAIADLVDYVIAKEFHHILLQEAHIFLVEASPRILANMPDTLSSYAKRVLLRKRIIIQNSTRVENIEAGQVVTSKGTIKGNTIIWAAGVKPVSLEKWLGVEADESGAVSVQENLSVKNLPNVFVIGDSATFIQNGKPLPALASVAKQQGKYLAKFLYHRIAGKEYKPFHYRDWGIMATIGRNEAAANFGNFTLKGRLAWFVWGVVHIFFLTGFRNRIAVFLNWVWTYLTFGAGARILIKQERGNEK
ncbi:MAG: FAD-dependent oxidoreductase [Gammaproteobacteria bacterium]|jgi:NADH dehydrogenase|nr:FAD-dependent oxidoreductase [Gammaproteobacteria bacterium]